jgi:hypothetical protein
MIDTYGHEQALNAVCRRCHSHTRVIHCEEYGGQLHADIRSELEDPRDLAPRFEKIGYDVVQIANMGSDHFHFTMNIQDGAK